VNSTFITACEVVKVQNIDIAQMRLEVNLRFDNFNPIFVKPTLARSTEQTNVKASDHIACSPFKVNLKKCLLSLYRAKSYARASSIMPVSKMD